MASYWMRTMSGLQMMMEMIQMVRMMRRECLVVRRGVSGCRMLMYLKHNTFIISLESFLNNQISLNIQINKVEVGTFPTFDIVFNSEPFPKGMAVARVVSLLHTKMR